MRTSIKSIPARKMTLLIRTLFACLVMLALSSAPIATWAGPAQTKAEKALAKWKAAKEAVAAAKEKLADAQKALQNAMTAVAKSGGKTTAAQEEALAQGRAAVARAEAALHEAEKQELAARVELESEIADLPDGPLKDQLKRERNYPSVVIANGLRTVKFDTPSGPLTLNLPDDMRAGDTITGTVIPEPKGSTEEERNTNRGVLNGYVVQIEGQNFPVNKGSVGPFSIRRMEMPTPPEMLPGPNSFFDVFFAVTLNDSAAARARIPLLPSGAVITPDPKLTPTFVIPPLGQTGRPIVITGPFDGNSSNTTIDGSLLMRNPKGFAGLGPIAESPRKAVFIAPTDVTGSMELHLKEGNKEATGNHRNVGVNLTAPKTSLLKNESTTLKVEVSGLEGITEPVPLHLVKGGVVTMQGGDVQSMTIKPAEVQSDGTFTTTRTVTGVQAGVWSATATVVVFDGCLQDDNNGNLLVFSSETGDYIFCPGKGTLAGANPMPVSTLNFLGTDFSGGVRVPVSDINDSGGSGTGHVSIGPGASITRSGSVTVADFNYKVGSIHVQIDGYNHTGSASGFVYQQITVPSNASPKKVNFTITDKDTRNNTCACK